MIRTTARIVVGTLCFVGPAILAGTVVKASDCPDFGLQDEARVAFCTEFQELLYAPYNPDSKRGNEDQNRREFEKILGSDPLWGEVYRSDPKKTLELIERIRQAGGLAQDRD